jgi:hypothetical protein
MEIQERISRQRVKHIIESYQLGGNEVDAFSAYLEDLLKQYPHPVIELALTEGIVKGWKVIPMVKGMPFLEAVHKQLKTWETQPIISTVTPAQFHQITGLDASVVFGPDALPDAVVTQPPLLPQGASESP